MYYTQGNNELELLLIRNPRSLRSSPSPPPLPNPRKTRISFLPSYLTWYLLITTLTWAAAVLLHLVHSCPWLQLNLTKAENSCWSR